MKNRSAYLSAALIAAIGFSTFGRAAEVTVDCDGSDPAKFNSISAALEFVSLEGPNTIIVRPGLCIENVVVDSRERLTIIAPDGQVIINPVDPERPVVHVLNSRDIFLRLLAADNSNAAGYAITASTAVRLL